MIDVCNPAVIRELLAKYGFHFSKSKGQNFLTQRWVPERIVCASGIDKTCGVIEIGPGFGPLTQELCQKAGKVVAIEVDQTLQPVLRETVGEFSNLEILFADALKTDLPAMVADEFSGLRPVACANLPYYITSPVLTKLLESRCFSLITVMVQREVAQRICAAPGSRDYSAFTVLCNYHAQPELLFDVPASCFFPQPKVTSTVLRLDCRKEPPVSVKSERIFFRTVRGAFAVRRKTLLNALSSAFAELNKDELRNIIISCGFDEKIRGETLGIGDFAKISDGIWHCFNKNL